MTYQIQTIACPEELSNCPEFSVSCANWGGSYRPPASGRLGCLKNAGFLLEMTCSEKNPVKTFSKTNDPVYQDSCMEGFFNFKPKIKGSGYLNFEMNANGAMLSQYGTSRHDRTYLTDMGIIPPDCSAFLLKEQWRVSLLISFELLERIYGDSTFHKGSKIRCNFFKVGENDIGRHYMSYRPIISAKPDFHLPEFFGEAEII